MRALEVGQDPQTGWWSYIAGTGPQPGGTSAFFKPPDYVNLSTTQFAMLGLWAANRLEPVARPRVVRRHLEALLEYQSPDGSWPYDAVTAAASGPSR